MPTVICHAKLGVNTFPSSKRPPWHRALAMGWHNGAGGANAPRFQGTGFSLCSGAQQMAALWVPVPQQHLHEVHQAPSSKSKGAFVLRGNALQTTPNKSWLLEEPAQSTAAFLSPVVPAGSAAERASGSAGTATVCVSARTTEQHPRPAEAAPLLPALIPSRFDAH